MKGIAQQLREARALIEQPERWTQGHLARSRLGRPIGPEASGACRWCLAGAVIHVGGSQNTPNNVACFHALERLTRCLLEAWNDDPARTHAEVLALIDRAIELAEV